MASTRASASSTQRATLRSAQASLLALVVCCTNAILAAEPATLSSDAAVDTGSVFGQSQPLAQPRNNGVLPVDSAFALTALVEAESSIVLMWEIGEGYYLYQNSLAVETADGSVLDALALPEAEETTDEFFGTVPVYRDRLLVRIPLQDVNAHAGSTVELLLTYQGCAEKSYCYPPVQKQVSLALPE